MTKRFDVIVVGAGCAGAASALLFARAGWRVLLLDRARFPRDTLSTHYIHQPGVAMLARWGVLDTVVASGCPPLETVSYQVADIRMTGRPMPAGEVGTAYAPRRRLLDPLLVAAAVTAGVEFADGRAVRDLLFDGERVVGVRLAAAVERAALVVGADGMRSRVARRVGARYLAADPTMTCAYYTYWPPLADNFELYEAPGSLVGAIPTNDATVVGVYFPQSDFGRVRTDAMAAYLDSVGRIAPAVRERMACTAPQERLYGTGDQRNFFRVAAGPGWALVGDAAHHKDSITARGITDAFRQAEALVAAVGADPHDEERVRAGLRSYADGFVDMFAEAYQGALFAALLSVDEQRLAMLRAVSASRDLIERYFGTIAGTCSLEALYGPELVDALGD